MTFNYFKQQYCCWKIKLVMEVVWVDGEQLSKLVEELYSVVHELEKMFPGRHFTPDGHLVGSLGECLAAHHYGLDLLPASTQGVDALKGEKRVEIKATQGRRVALRCAPEHLLVLKLNKRGGFQEVYNGPGSLVWEQLECKPAPSNGQYQISLERLKSLMKKVPEKDRIPMLMPNNTRQPMGSSVSAPEGAT
ncbi:DUF6998 domain-containing protein [Thauera mechernichensis]|uniref:DUF6998 domain-containing protein n=1 Tax=Thauera mechernichensis TaxID=82788 RepID=A0ABW3W9A2_9RHOO|nr:hypothetical protein [Thauera mechernichensis]MDG3066589.1 hypothetical protein [Thauera mechernichensis]